MSTRNTPAEGPSSNTKMAPPKDAGVVESVASPLATLSSHVDPWPHYIMSAACAGGSWWSYSSNNPRNAMIKAGFAAAYLMAGRLLVTGDPKTGYDLGSIASLGLTAWAGPAAKRSGDALMAGMAALGAVSSAGNLVKSYEMRTGKPRELEMRHR